MRPGERQEGLNSAAIVIPDTTVPTAAPVSPAPGSAESADGSGVPEAVRGAARSAPGHWVGVVDPEWTEARTPPEWAVLGEWQSDESGSVGEYRANPAYRPSARVLGWPEPTDPVDAAAQRAATGYGSVEAALAALAESDVTVMRGPDGGPLAAVGRDGAPVVLLFTSPTHEFMSAELLHDTLSVRELARSLEGPGTMLMVNAGAAAPLLVPAESLPGPAPAEGGARASAATVAATEDGPGGTAGTAVPAGATAAARSADRADSSSQPWPQTKGRTP
ncbi:type VII secretion system-associated protein [Streptomyces finlayi]|uniref:Type VII secretion system-associated protein n=1 Tax=Streptomyces finlayi TaxID=67296 RepID=A0A7G7BW46_9ACTN|nr:type VII secretion system-associated protein [Streptomyces finlayi]QNE79561.1 type VII secretion system-associated protein [Streptomyces finlayi]